MPIAPNSLAFFTVSMVICIFVQDGILYIKNGSGNLGVRFIFGVLREKIKLSYSIVAESNSSISLGNTSMYSLKVNKYWLQMVKNINILSLDLQFACFRS